jgi:hypothetical protein
LSSYYLCSQTRQGDIDVIDSFFLLQPQATFETPSTLTQEGVQLDFQEPVAETVLEQVAEATNPSNMTQEGVQLNFGSGTGPGANSMPVATVENALARNTSKTGRNPIDTTSSSRTETETSAEETAVEAVSLDEALSQSRGQLSGLGGGTTPTLGGGYGG